MRQLNLARRPGRCRRVTRPSWAAGGGRAGWLFALPALGFYAVFNLRPVLLSIQYSFYDWDGIGASTWVGLDNYIEVFTDAEQFSSLLHAFYLILFFTALPVALALISASVIREIRGRFSGSLARTMMFLPQIIPGGRGGSPGPGCTRQRRGQPDTLTVGPAASPAPGWRLTPP
jgi:raffinose/stachyose/melibiose transport system permease protein